MEISLTAIYRINSQTFNLRLDRKARQDQQDQQDRRGLKVIRVIQDQQDQLDRKDQQDRRTQDHRLLQQTLHFQEL
jgi:hypothetical protein